MRRVLAMGVVFALCTAGVASAGTISYHDSISLAPTNWENETVTIPLFNPGTDGIPAAAFLTSIEFELAGHVEGSAAFESQDADSTTVEMSLEATIELKRPTDDTVIVQSIPFADTSDDVTAYDGVDDFGGTSGKTYPALSANKTESTVSPPPGSDLALFTGAGNIDLPIEATGTSFGSGAGNLLLQFATSASAEVWVTYTYDVPEPASLSILALGGVALLRRRR